MPRIIAIWVFGILASAIFGGMIGDLLLQPGGGLMGAVGGILAFACARLWLASPSQKTN